MISEKTLQFLQALKENNYREWFHEHKTWYQESREDFIALVSAATGLVQKLDPNVGNPQPSDCIFRINRDIRFSPDKSPYKTNFGAYIANGGRKSSYAGYYVHIEPSGSFLAGGKYMPTPAELKAIRGEIYYNPDDFLAMVNHKDFKKNFGSFTDSGKLKTAPKGFPKDWEHIEWLRYKNYAVMKHVPDEIVTSPKFLDEVKATFAALLPVNKWLNFIASEAQGEGKL